MRTQTWQLAMGLILAGFTAGVQSAAAHSPELDVRFTVYVSNYADVDSKTLANAEKMAAGIFRKAGVESRWVDAAETAQNQSENLADQTNLSHIQLHILSPAMAGRLGLPSNVMGLAPGDGPDRRLVYLFFDRVRQLAQTQALAQVKGTIDRRASADQILGEMMAHEIGHILLNLPSHSETGIMRGNWDLRDLNEVSYGYLIFTQSQAEAIRAEVVRRVRQQQTLEVAGLESPTLAR